MNISISIDLLDFDAATCRLIVDTMELVRQFHNGDIDFDECFVMNSELCRRWSSDLRREHRKAWLV